MPSGGAPPFPGTGLAELELIEDGDTNSNALRLSGTAALIYSGLAVTLFYGQAQGAPAWVAHASGLNGWRMQETGATNLAKYMTQFGVPVYQNYAPYAQGAIRHRRYRYAALIGRTTVPSVGGCGIGLYQPTAVGGLVAGSERGVELRSMAGIYGGNWHVARRWYGADAVTLYADTGIPATAAPFRVLFDFITGPVAPQLVVSVNGVTVATLAGAELPQLGPDGSFCSGLPGAWSNVTGTPGQFQLMQSSFRQDRLT